LRTCSRTDAKSSRLDAGLAQHPIGVLLTHTELVLLVAEGGRHDAVLLLELQQGVLGGLDLFLALFDLGVQPLGGFTGERDLAVEVGVAVGVADGVRQARGALGVLVAHLDQDDVALLDGLDHEPRGQRLDGVDPLPRAGALRRILDPGDAEEVQVVAEIEALDHHGAHHTALQDAVLRLEVLAGVPVVRRAERHDLLPGGVGQVLWRRLVDDELRDRLVDSRLLASENHRGRDHQGPENEHEHFVLPDDLEVVTQPEPGLRIRGVVRHSFTTLGLFRPAPAVRLRVSTMRRA
jgi:hypothetical protein